MVEEGQKMKYEITTGLFSQRVTFWVCEQDHLYT
jgi:hypothetical protein